MTAYTFDQLIDFTRTSAATYVDASGRIVPTAASRNLLTFTQEFDNAAWVKTRASVSADQVAAPDGTLTADKLIEDTTASNSHRVQRTITLTGASVTFSAYLKAAERTFAYLRMDDASTVKYVYVDLSTGALGTVTSGVTGSVTSVGNGWYRVSMVFVAPAATASGVVVVGSAASGSSDTYTGNGTSGIYLWGAQLEANATATDYTRNNGGVFPPRLDYDPVTLAPKGLLVEEQRTNLFTYSEQFDGPSWTPTNLTVTANSTTSPDGTVDADTLNEGTATGVHSIAQVFSATTGTSYALSVYLKNGDARYAQLFFGSAGHGSTAFANFDLQAGTVGTVGAAATASIQPAGNGWYRCTIVAAATATTASASAQIGVITSSTSARAESYTGASKFFYAWGIQTEAGSFATSYIPTVASQVTRTADVATITGANFSQWYNQSEGTFVVEADVLSVANTNDSNLIALYTGTFTAMRQWIWPGAPTTPRMTVLANGGSQAELVAASGIAANATFKIASAYKTNDFSASFNGATPVTDTSGTVPTGFSQLNIGSYTGFIGFMSGHIRSVRYYPTRLSNAQLQALTA
ncbi:MAG: hypothetical protein ABFD96_01495 [Armatimonadia bacterium]